MNRSGTAVAMMGRSTLFRNGLLTMIVMVVVGTASVMALPPTGILRVQNDNRNTPSSSLKKRRRVMVECSVQPLFLCSSCQLELRKQQQLVMEAIEQQYADATLLSTSERLLNALHISFNINGNESPSIATQYIRGIPGVIEVFEGEDFSFLQPTATPTTKGTPNTVGDIPTSIGVVSSPTLATMPTTTMPPTTITSGSTSTPTTLMESAWKRAEQRVGIDVARQLYCSTGKGVQVAILDTGVDYTHKSLGGPGTIQAYLEAYGVNESSTANKVRGNYFPTAKVTNGYDVVGDLLTPDEDYFQFAQPDNNPIDKEGHGTAVADVVATLAPGAELIAVKVCLSSEATCPDYAVIAGLEYALDPNNDTKTDDHVQVINISLGRRSTSAYYSRVAKAIDDAVAMGALVVVAIGNDGNQPYVAGGLSNAPLALSVGATSLADLVLGPVATSYSSRGPSDLNTLKPDLSAPGGYFVVALAGTGDQYFSAVGTSFAAPIVSATAALLMEKCPECSPFAIKAMLSNNANRHIKYDPIVTEGNRAPLSLVGCGEVNIQHALEAEYWAYSVDDVQPSISIGLVDASEDMTFRRRIKVENLSGSSRTLSFSYEFRDTDKGARGSVSISFSSEVMNLDAVCGSSALVDVEFYIDASKAPPNSMSSGGTDSLDPAKLDQHEYDGWIVVSSNSSNSTKPTEINVPFYMILRQAANVSLSNNRIATLSEFPKILPVNLSNTGAGEAQIDVYDLLVISNQSSQPPIGSDKPPSDFKYIGYRVVPLNDGQCSSLLEFAFNTWERQTTLQTLLLFVDFDLDADNEADFSLYNSGYLYGSTYADCRIHRAARDQSYCTGFPPDHATNSATTILRMCADDLGIGTSGVVNVSFGTHNYPRTQDSDSTNQITISFSNATASTQSFNLAKGESFNEIMAYDIKATGRNALGLLLLTNSYRSEEHTGASLPETEAITIVYDGVAEFLPRTQSKLRFPVAKNVAGPNCAWIENEGQCLRLRNLRAKREIAWETRILLDVDKYPVFRAYPVGEDHYCMEQGVPRLLIPTNAPSQSIMPFPSIMQSDAPSNKLSVFHLPTAVSSFYPSASPSLDSPVDLLQTQPSVLSLAPVRSSSAPVQRPSDPTTNISGLPSQIRPSASSSSIGFNYPKVVLFSCFTLSQVLVSFLLFNLL